MTSEAARLGRLLSAEFDAIQKFELPAATLDAILGDMLPRESDRELALKDRSVRSAYANRLRTIAKGYLMDKVDSDSHAGPARVERLLRNLKADAEKCAKTLEVIFKTHPLYAALCLPEDWKPNFWRNVRRAQGRKFEFDEILHRNVARDQMVGPLIVELREFQSIIEFTIKTRRKVTNRRNRGRPFAQSFFWLVLSLKLLYERGIVWDDSSLSDVAGHFEMRKAGVGWDTIKRVYTGPFVRTVHRTLAACGEKPRAETLGRRIQKVLRGDRLKEAEARLIAMNNERRIEEQAEHARLAAQLRMDQKP